jgi:probable phosphoglycerate mutase
MTRLIFVRHGETHKNVAKVLHGTKDDAPLNGTGRRQAEISAGALTKMNVSVVYSSTELRARETAQIIGKVCNIPTIYIDNFRERSWGVFEGRPWSDVIKVLGPLTLEDRFRYKPEEGESWQEVEERLVLEVKRILNNNPKKNAVIVTHGGTIRTLIPYLLGTSRDESFKYDPRHLSFTIFDFENGKFKKVMIDDVSHLDIDVRSQDK